MKDIYERIEKLAKEKKIKQNDLAEKLELSSPQIFANWKQRNSSLDIKTAVKIADILGVSVEYLVTGKETNSYKLKYDNLKNAVIDAIAKN